MKKSNLLLNLLLAVLLIGGFTACKEDDPVIDTGDGIPVGDGMYITEVGVDPVSTSKLIDEVVENEGFATQVREGFMGGYAYLTAGNYNLVTVIDKAITQTLGGTPQALTHTSGNCEDFNYIMVESEVDGAAFNIPNNGLYKFTYDTDTGEILIMEITKMGLIGSGTSIGWSDTETVDLPASSISATGAAWSGTEIVLREGEFKLRFNCNWVVDRRIDSDAGFAFENAYQMYTNWGGSFTDLQPGAANFPVSAKGGAAPDEGTYDVDVTWSAENGFLMELSRTGDAPELTFDPADWKWGAIGPATDNGWDGDQQIGYVDWASGWYGDFYLSDVVTNGEGFKFRSDDVWSAQLNNGNTSIISDIPGDFTNADGNDTWVLSGPMGLYYATIKTDDEGANWALTLDRAVWGVIGTPTPGGWDADTDMTAAEDTGTITYSITGIAMTTGDFKFRMNDDWPRQLGFTDFTAITGTSAGVLSAAAGDNNITISTAGTYDLILSTTDHGATYSLEIN
jgi:hypothetical protein